jgi:hypothetical protein
VNYLRVLIIVTAIVSAPIITRADQQMDDVVYLKNGSIIRGMILEQVPNQSLKIQTKDGNLFVYQMSEVEKITKEAPIKTSIQSSGQHNPGYKSPGVAFALSFLVPGTGQMYNGQTKKGILMLIGAAAGYTLFIVERPRNEEVWVYNYYDSYDYGYWDWQDKGNGAIAYPALALGLGMQIWSMIDAPTTASRINMKSGQASNGLNLGKNITLSYSPFSFSKIGLGPNARLVWKF